MEPLPTTSCPQCCEIRKAQGFDVVVDVTKPLCISCATWKADNEYVNSLVYKAWIASIPTTSIEAIIEWIRLNPPPSRS